MYLRFNFGIWYRNRESVENSNVFYGFFVDEA